MTSLRTLCVRSSPPDPLTGALHPPIHSVTTYAQEELGGNPPFTYSRSSNPTVVALEEKMAALERGVGALAFSSGMAALDALFRVLLRKGDHVVVSDVVYGGTLRLLREYYIPYGVEVSEVDSSNPSNVEEALKPRTRLVLLETPANPTLKLSPISKASDVARRAGALLAVDNTLLTPLGQRVFEHGADVSLHSTTKLIEGHGSTIGGALVVREDRTLLDRLFHFRKSAGTIQNPFFAWLTLRGVVTLPLRLEFSSTSASQVAAQLEKHPAVERVLHPSLSSFPQRDLALRQHQFHGSIVSFKVRGGYRAARELCGHLRRVVLAENLGSCETILTHPSSMTHSSWTAPEREIRGIPEGLLRLSVGLEDPQEILEDLEKALDRLVEKGVRS